MSGSWLKVEISTPNKPEILEMSEALNLDPDTVFGKLFRVWSWFDEHTTDGHAPSVTVLHLNRVVGVNNFCEAMIATKWMKKTEKGISIPNFTRHHTKPSKDRALANLRKQAQRERDKEVSRTDRDISHASHGTILGPEKRREEIKETKKKKAAPDLSTQPDKQPSLEDVEKYISQEGMGCDGRKFFYYWAEREWVGVKNWKLKLKNFNTNDWAQKKTSTLQRSDNQDTLL